MPAKRRKRKKAAKSAPGKKCNGATCGLVLLIVGLLYLWSNLNGSANFWDIEWYTAAFLLLGLKMLWASSK